MLVYHPGDVVVVRQRPYQLLKLVGRGGQGSVYEARDNDGNVVALKFVPAQERHRSEVRVLASMQSDHIVRLLDAGVTRSSLILVMERVEGVDLKHLIHFCRHEKRMIPPRIAVEFIMQACLGLLEALQHGKLAFHRDIKPGNLILSRDGLIKLIDFGIAHLDDMAYTGSLVGTPENMAPEQIGLNDDWKVDLRTDLYCLGLVLYELLTLDTVLHFPQHMPVPERLLKVWQADVSQPVARVATILPALGDFLHKALRRDPADRFQSPVEMLHALSAVRDQLPEAGSLVEFADVTHRVMQRGEESEKLDLLMPSIEKDMGSSLRIKKDDEVRQKAELAFREAAERPPLVYKVTPRPWQRPMAMAVGAAVVLFGMGWMIFSSHPSHQPPTDPPRAGLQQTERALTGH